jgi:hypothetical protein
VNQFPVAAPRVSFGSSSSLIVVSQRCMSMSFVVCLFACSGASLGVFGEAIGMSMTLDKGHVKCKSED